MGEGRRARTHGPVQNIVLFLELLQGILWEGIIFFPRLRNKGTRKWKVKLTHGNVNQEKEVPLNRAWQMLPS